MEKSTIVYIDGVRKIAKSNDLTILDYGAVPDDNLSGAVNVQAFNLMRDDLGYVKLSGSEFFFNAPLLCPNAESVTGVDKTLSKINFVNSTDGLKVFAAPTNTSNSVKISDIRIQGDVNTGILLDVQYLQTGEIRNIDLYGSCSIGMYMDKCWGMEVSNINCRGLRATSKSVELVSDINACTFDNLYTSNHVPIQLHLSSSGRSCVFNNITLQGGDVGILIDGSGWRSCNWNSIYSENVVTNLFIGEGDPSDGFASGAAATQGMIFNNFHFSDPYVTNPYIGNYYTNLDLNNCSKIVFNNPVFLTADSDQLIVLNKTAGDCEINNPIFYADGGATLAQQDMITHVYKRPAALGGTGLTINQYLSGVNKSIKKVNATEYAEYQNGAFVSNVTFNTMLQP